jgi:energy-coupling factor transport system substrate-specific component
VRELIDMWSHTRMVVLTALTASLYAAILIPFKVLPIIPGITEFRPANAVPVVCSFLFGPAGAWGAAIGNVIGDFFGGFGPGDFFGFWGNLLYGFIPYRMWEIATRRPPVPRDVAGWVLWLMVVVSASAACGVVIGWGLNLLGFVPFRVLANVVLLNNTLSTCVIAPLLLAAVYPRAERARLTYRHVLVARQAATGMRAVAGLTLLLFGVGWAWLWGNAISSGSFPLAFLGELPDRGTGALPVGIGLVPPLMIVVIGLCLL